MLEFKEEFLMKRRILKTLKGTLAVVLAFSMCMPVFAAESKAGCPAEHPEP